MSKLTEVGKPNEFSRKSLDFELIILKIFKRSKNFNTSLIEFQKAPPIDNCHPIKMWLKLRKGENVRLAERKRIEFIYQIMIGVFRLSTHTSWFIKNQESNNETNVFWRKRKGRKGSKLKQRMLMGLVGEGSVKRDEQLITE